MTVPYQPPADTGGNPPGTPPQFNPGAPSPVHVHMPPPAAPATPTEPMYTQAQLLEFAEKTRTEEKNKLYPQLEKQKTQLQTLIEERDQRIADEAEAQRLAEEEQREREAAEMTAAQRLEQQMQERDQSWEDRFTKMQQERDLERALNDKAYEVNQLNEYRLTRLAQESDNIAPQLADFVRGNTKEEIDASIEQVKVKSEEIAQELQARQLGQRRQTAPGLTGAPPIDMAGATGDPQTQILTADDIRNMSVEEFAANRDAYLAAARNKVQADGMYAP